MKEIRVSIGIKRARHKNTRIYAYQPVALYYARSGFNDRAVLLFEDLHQYGHVDLNTREFPSQLSFSKRSFPLKNLAYPKISSNRTGERPSHHRRSVPLILA